MSAPEPVTATPLSLWSAAGSHGRRPKRERTHSPPPTPPGPGGGGRPCTHAPQQSPASNVDAVVLLRRDHVEGVTVDDSTHVVQREEAARWVVLGLWHHQLLLPALALEPFEKGLISRGERVNGTAARRPQLGVLRTLLVVPNNQTHTIAQSRKHEVELLAEVDTVFSRGYFVEMAARHEAVYQKTRKGHL
eukprot:scaffold130808_cov63-Phaeocystis_antarctica.AAC.7